jgi:rhamnosyltransferase
MSEMLNDLLVVIVLYKKKLEDSSTYRSLRAALSAEGRQATLFVYDNGPVVNNIEACSEFTTIYVSDPSNGGISKAYNVAARYAVENHKKWLLLFDQDSELPIKYLNVMVESVKRFPEHKMFVPVLRQGALNLSPCKFTFMKGSALPTINSGVMAFEDVSIFNSGILVSLELYLATGGYHEAIKLDFSDHYFIHQVKKLEREFVVLPIYMEHELSTHTKDEGNIKSRFKQYCSGVRTYGRIVGDRPFLFFWTFLRAVKLSITFKSASFIIVFVKNYMFGNEQSDTTP